MCARIVANFKKFSTPSLYFLLRSDAGSKVPTRLFLYFFFAFFILPVLVYSIFPSSATAALLSSAALGVEGFFIFLMLPPDPLDLFPLTVFIPIEKELNVAAASNSPKSSLS